MGLTADPRGFFAGPEDEDRRMGFVLQPWQLIFAILAGWATNRQQTVIDYLWVENQVLKENLGKKRILLSDDQRRRLAVKGKVLGRKALEQITTLVTPDTILRWHRQLIAEKWAYSDRRQPGRPPTASEVVEEVVRLARENPTWGYDRIQGALANLGHEISDTTVANILKEHGIEPAPRRRRRPSWRTFIKSHWDVLAAIDFTTIEVWSSSGLITYYLLFAMKVSTRQVCFAGCTASPATAWMQQV
jgi:transposase